MVRPSDRVGGSAVVSGSGFWMRRLAIALMLASLVVVPSAHAGTPPSTFSDNVFVSGLSQPTAIAFLPNGGMLITEKGGALKLRSGGTTSTLVTIPVCTASEMGLLGVAVDPAFSGDDGFIYLYRSAPSATGCASSTGRFNQIVRVTMVNGTVNISSLSVLLTGIVTDNGNHDGGGLRIGPDNKLWAIVGDSGVGDMGNPGDSTNPYAQDLGSLNGKVLRLELTGAPAAGNPFIGTPGARPEIYAYGFRNPFRFGFDPVSGKAWVGDVGQSTLEELDIIQAGGNYSWPYCEGTLPPGCTQPGDVPPIYEYGRTVGTTIIGGAFAPANFGNLGGQYFFADFGVSTIWSAVPTPARDDIAAPVNFVTGAQGPVDIVFGPDGAMYYVALNVGTVRQVVPNYARPRGATPTRASLVPAYASCTTPNRTHGAPLVFGSCTPPSQQSGFLTVGTPDANGAQVNSNGFVLIRALPGDEGTPADEADVALTATITDVRNRPALTDYAGQLQARLPIRITDLDNPPPAGGSAQGTTQDGTFAFTIPCTTTGSGTVGSTCSVSTTADAVSAGVIKEADRSVWQLGQIDVLDGGPDGNVSTNDNTVFMRQGVFVP
jgi:glucose/arabinose dehydrogenase